MKAIKLNMLLLLLALTFSCNRSSTAEQEYIHNLEEKNKLLEQEIQDLKGSGESNKESVSDSESEDYFTIGSSEKTVLSVIGDPNSYHDNGGGNKTFMYGLSFVEFENGKVVSYDDLSGNLKVHLPK